MFIVLHRHWPTPPAVDQGGIFGLDSSWGTWPQWVTAAVAVVVGGFSIFGILTARKSYKENVWQTTVAVARLVYADTEFRKRIAKGDRRARLASSGVAYPFGKELFTEGRDSLGAAVMFANDDLTGFRVTVHNNSDEPIGNVELHIYAPNGERIEGAWPMQIGVIKQKEQATCSVWIADGGAEMTHWESARGAVSFTDSAGTNWVRVGISPPEVVKS